MVVHQNSGGLDPQVVPGVRQTLVEVTSQLNTSDSVNQPAPIAQPPQVVFVGSEGEASHQQTFQQPTSPIAEAQTPAVQQAAVQHRVEVKIQRRTRPNAETVALPPQTEAATGQQEVQPSEVKYIPPPIVAQASQQREAPVAPGPSFLVDPFDQGVDGPIPVLPSLPVAKAIEMTESVVSRENAGEHYAWRLQRPYPDLGNSPQDSEPAKSPSEDAVPTTTVSEAERAVSASEKSRVETETVSWSNTEVVSEGDSGQHGDNFYAQSGDIISIDGNQGYDHIDLRSYSIEDATFQPGSILLSSSHDRDNALEAGSVEPPIIIRHRGVAFAMFKGEVRVEL